MSYSATSEALSDPLAFPYFARVVPPDVAQAAVMVEMAKDVGWNSICIMFQDDDYGTRGALATSSKACAEGLTVVTVASYDARTHNVTEAVGIITLAAASTCSGAQS